MERDEVLKILRETGGLLNGHFELRSGLHSDVYFQCASVLRFPEVAARLCTALVEKMRQMGPALLNVDAVIAPALGGILVGYEVARALGVASIFVEKQDGKLALRRFTIRRGERFIVAEDVVTRGGRVEETIRIVREHGGQVAAIAMLVDRSGGKAHFDVPACSLLKLEPQTWEPETCPLCARGIPFSHPGS
ncbi:MAG: orotate phosphoribosyltransferase [Kiritimatiellia bacterium]